jgi:uncharacterized membrane protein
MPAKKPGNVFLTMHPLHRVLISLFFSLVTFLFIVKYHLSTMMTSMILWDVFAMVNIIFSWIIFFTSSVAHITKHAQQDDGSRVFVFNIVVFSSFASMFMVLMLMTSNQTHEISKSVYLAITIAGILLSWIMVHTSFCFHYARLYYKPDKKEEKTATGLNFPNELHPDYLDFAYFSFIIGMTFQVSDVQINTRTIRRLALAHALISFVLNTFVVALTINLIAGLRAAG